MVLATSVDYCYSDIGCFPLSDEFYHPKHRPFNVRPWHRQHIRTQFELFNKDHPEGFIMLPWNRKNLLRSKFNPKLETKIIVPGWLDNINRALWVRKLKDALLYLWVPVNIVVVRWTNFTPYTIATANTRVVGAEMANMMKFIDKELHYDPAYYHIIGHSLGAHIAGYCGDRIHGLGRITALDPARPFFQHMPKSVRLDRSDAKFVDAIHSDFTPENAIFLLMSYGMTTPVGHLDFYPNGPPLYQPGCIRDTLLSVQNGIARGLEHNSLSIAFLESIRYLTACDHQRSHEWFIESITNRECAFVGVRCNEFEGMINGRCTCDDSPSACAIMGIHADQMFLHKVHEELWPVRAGSIDYKYKKKATPRPAVSQPAAFAFDQAPGVYLEELGESMEHNYDLLAHAALLQQHQQHSQAALLSAGLPMPPTTKDEIYAQLKYQAMQMHNQGEPSISPLVYQDETTDRSTESPQSAQTGPGTSDQQEPEVPRQDDQMAAGSDIEETFEQHMNALDDMAFVGYLRSQFLLSQLDKLDQRQGDVSPEESAQSAQSAQNASLSSGDDAPSNQIDQASKTDQLYRRSSQKHGQPEQFAGHPLLISGINRDIESWYEDNGRWHLKTNNQPKYCSNQYQLLIFLGPLKSARARERLRADLLVSIVGSRGQLLNQRFVPRGQTLTSFTMQPFFILLEGSYSLGQIRSVAISWEARHDPDPIQATISFQSSELQKLGENVAIYKAKQFPWLPEEFKYDKTSHFRPPSLNDAPTLLMDSLAKKSNAAASLSSSDETSAAAAALYKLRYERPSMSLKSAVRGHYSQRYKPRRRHDTDRSGLSPLKTGPKTGENQGACSVKKLASCQKASSGNRKPKLLRRSDVDEHSETLDEFEAAASSNRPATSDYDYELEEMRDQLGELLQLKQANQLQREEILANRLVLPVADSTKAPMPNDTTSDLLADQSENQQQSIEEDQSEDKHLAGDLNVQESDPYFVRVVDPIDDTASYTPHPNIPVLPEHQLNQEGKITIDLHNSDLKFHSAEDSIVINQVIVSPVQANYGRLGRNAKTFCPPLTKQRLTRDKTLRLNLSMMSRCSEHHHYEQQMQNLRLFRERQYQYFVPQQELQAY